VGDGVTYAIVGMVVGGISILFTTFSWFVFWRSKRRHERVIDSLALRVGQLRGALLSISEVTSRPGLDDAQRLEAVRKIFDEAKVKA
jgi:hypothetical protein